MRKSAFGQNFKELTVSSGGLCISKSFIGLSSVPRPRLFVVEVEVPKPKVDAVLPNPVFVEPNISLRSRQCSDATSTYIVLVRS